MRLLSDWGDIAGCILRALRRHSLPRPISSKDPNRQDHHVTAGELQALLQSEGRVIVQQPGKKVFFLEYQLAAEEHGARKLLRHRGAQRFQFGNKIDAQVIAVFGVPAETIREFHQALEILLGVLPQAFDFLAPFELAGVDDADGNEDDIFVVIGKEPLQVQQVCAAMPSNSRDQAAVGAPAAFGGTGS
jgi:hypothetical protein